MPDPHSHSTNCPVPLSSPCRYNTIGACVEYGKSPGSDAFSLAANEACCVCGGASLGAYFQFQNGETPSECMYLYAIQTTNGNPIIQYPCNDRPAQQWFVDSSYNNRSTAHINKCIVGSYGATTSGTNLVIYDCMANDSRFIFPHGLDRTFRVVSDLSCVLEHHAPGHKVDGQESKYRSVVEVIKSGLQSVLSIDANFLHRAPCSDAPNDWYDRNGDN